MCSHKATSVAFFIGMKQCYKYLTMHKYKDAPDWLYFPANVGDEESKIIQKELSKLYVLTKQDTLSGFIVNDLMLISKVCPTLTDFLKRNKLFDLLSFLVTIVVYPGKGYDVHVDGSESVGLNFPLLNCEDSCTVWYDAEILDQPTHNRSGVKESSVRICDQTSLVEIGRLDSTIPSWINLNIPHRPEVKHNNLRVAYSLRFDPAPLVNGQLWPELVKL